MNRRVQRLCNINPGHIRQYLCRFFDSDGLQYCKNGHYPVDGNKEQVWTIGIQRSINNTSIALIV